LLPFFSSHCEKETGKQKSPTNIIDSFFKKYVPDIDHQEQINRLFRFIQYIERQVVLFDAIEDSSFTKIGNFDNAGTMHGLLQQVDGDDDMRANIKGKVKNIFITPGAYRAPYPILSRHRFRV
jgi:phosphoenolpyruvate carboxylase